ncbi:hypothetical protein BU26DRAFT_22978 [Trematosphaeria pertusa]|uniref:Uncharacterized protein n=1 Tax=Trematosphaeria pertusa TaxID=390896 RepID=A0A6A6J295_9PLEO|nr:uncharacterized protein BU26DRAFT_22978 [Trematosphaeria pertusa]KAF2256467.1 hypothetical protein BU26DRAFT_22978 [Trematosphaeria pertusa]
MFGILLACFALVAVPIIAVQYQRFIASCLPCTDSDVLSEPDDTGLDGAGEKPQSRSGTDEKIQRGAGASVSKEGGMRTTRKPWDPPFPMSENRKGSGYLVLEPSPPTRRQENATEEQKEEMGDGEVRQESVRLPVTAPGIDRPPVDELLRNRSSAMPKTTPTASSRPSDSSSRLSLVQTFILILAFLIFVFAFAILVAHCLAWFVVYKTEARLGEARKGLLRGGDMRVCLCARG